MNKAWSGSRKGAEYLLCYTDTPWQVNGNYRNRVGGCWNRKLLVRGARRNVIRYGNGNKRGGWVSGRLVGLDEATESNSWN